MPLIIDREKLAYAAGLFDGEGHTCYNVSKQSLKSVGALRLQLKMTDLEPIQKFRNALNNIPKLNGPYKNGPKETHNDIYVCLIQNFEDFQFCICLLWQWLSLPKQQQAANALKNYIGMYNYLNKR